MLILCNNDELYSYHNFSWKQLRELKYYDTWECRVNVLIILFTCTVHNHSSLTMDSQHTVCKRIHYLQGHQRPHRVQQQEGKAVVGKAVVGKAAQEAHQHLLVCLEEHQIQKNISKRRLQFQSKQYICYPFFLYFKQVQDLKVAYQIW